MRLSCSAIPAEQDDDIQRPASISEAVWKVVELAAAQNETTKRTYVERVLLDEALILEQMRFGRKWFVQDKRGNMGEVDFNWADRLPGKPVPAKSLVVSTAGGSLPSLGSTARRQSIVPTAEYWLQCSQCWSLD